MKPALVDVSVLVLFFNRPTMLAQVFAQIQKASPARLFLYQDGARNEQDIPPNGSLSGNRFAHRLGMRGAPAVSGTEFRVRSVRIHFPKMGILTD